MNPTIQDLSPAQFDFIQRTYVCLFITLLAMTFIGIFSYSFLPRISIYPLFVLDTLIWIACGWFGLRNPIKAIFPVFLVITGLFLGQIAHRYHPQIFLAASITTLAIFGAVSGYVLWSKRDFSFLRAGLNICFFILLAMMVLLFFSKLAFYL